MKNLNLNYTSLLFCTVLGLSAGIAMSQTLWNNQEKIIPKKIVNKAYFPVKNCINIGNGLDAPNEGEWGYTYRPEHLKSIKSAGFDTVRILVKWSGHTSGPPYYTIDEKFISRVDEVIKMAFDAKLNIIMDVHHFDELYENPDENEPKLIAIWTQLAEHYKNAPQNLIFELINEPRDNFSGARVNKVQNFIVSEIRKANPTRTIILSGDQWGTIDGMKNIEIPDDPYIVASVHYYNPYEFTHQGAEWLKDAPPNGRGFPIGDDIKNLDKDVIDIVNWQKKLGVPVFVGEYGTYQGIENKYRVQWAYETSKRFRAANLYTCYFNFTAGFDTYNRETDTWNKPMLEAIGIKREK